MIENYLALAAGTMSMFCFLMAWHLLYTAPERRANMKSVESRG